MKFLSAPESNSAKTEMEESFKLIVTEREKWGFVLGLTELWLTSGPVTTGEPSLLVKRGMKKLDGLPLHNKDTYPLLSYALFPWG